MRLLAKTLMIITAGMSMATVTTMANANNQYKSNEYIDSKSINPYYADGYTGQAYVGIKGGIYNGYGDGMKDSNKNNLEDPLAYGVYAGYHFDRNFSAEVEYTGSEKADYDIQTIGAYGAYHVFLNDSRMYVKGKLGLAKELDTDDSTNLAGGVGLGYAASPNIDVAADYARVYSEDQTDQHVDMLSFGAKIKF